MQRKFLSDEFRKISDKDWNKVAEGVSEIILGILDENDGDFGSLTSEAVKEKTREFLSRQKQPAHQQNSDRIGLFGLPICFGRTTELKQRNYFMAHYSAIGEEFKSEPTDPFLHFYYSYRAFNTRVKPEGYFLSIQVQLPRQQVIRQVFGPSSAPSESDPPYLNPIFAESENLPQISCRNPRGERCGT
jgi:hypothetical protein